MDEKLYSQGPDDRLDYDVDFERDGWLAPGDTIATVNEVTIAVGTVTSDEHTFTGTVVKVWLLGGVVGETAKIKVEITSVQGRTKEVCFQLRIRERCI